MVRIQKGLRSMSVVEGLSSYDSQSVVAELGSMSVAVGQRSSQLIPSRIQFLGSLCMRLALLRSPIISYRLTQAMGSWSYRVPLLALVFLLTGVFLLSLLTSDQTLSKITEVMVSLSSVLLMQRS